MDYTLKIINGQLRLVPIYKRYFDIKKKKKKVKKK